MNISLLLEDFHKENTLSNDIIELIQNDNELRIDLVNYFREYKFREFALVLLDTFISIREKTEGNMPSEDLMLACYLVGLHQHIEDCLTIWKAKTIDFDTYCGLDIQLVPFAGVSETLTFLKKQSSEEAKQAFEYVSECYKYGDFNNLDDYYSVQSMPWFV